MNLSIKDTTESIPLLTSYLDLLLSIGGDGQLHSSIYDKRDDFNFHITNFPFLGSNDSVIACVWRVSSLNLYDTPGLAPRMNVLFWGPGDFPVSVLKQGYLVERLKYVILWKYFMVDTGILLSYGVTLSRNVKCTNSDPWPTVTFLPIRLSTNFMTFIPSLNLHRITEWFPWSIWKIGCG